MQLTLDQIKAAAHGAVRILQEEAGISFFRFTEEQEALYSARNPNFYSRTFCTAGVKLRFRTNSPRLILDGEMRKVQSSRTYYSLDVLADGKPVGSVDNFSNHELPDDYTQGDYPYGSFRKEFTLGSGEKTVTIVFPWSANLCLRSVTLDDKSTFLPVRASRTYLSFGDSITQGYDALRPSNRYAARLAEALDAEEFCKAIGGEIFFPELAQLADPMQPDYITVAYGTNDWSQSERDVFLKNSRAFYEALCRSYPNAKIFALAPIWRKDRTENKPFGIFEQVAFRLQTMHLAYKSGIWRTKLAFRLQICSFQFTNKHLALQTGVSDYNSACLPKIPGYGA